MKSLRETFSPHKGKKAVSEPSQAAHVVAEASTPFRGQQNILQEAAQNRQRANNLVARMRWAESDKGSFKNLIKKLRHDNDYFGSILGLQKSLQMNETRAILEDQVFPIKAIRTAGRLKMLMEAVTDTKDSSCFSFSILLHNDPFELRNLIAHNVDADILMMLHPDSSMFALQLIEPRDGRGDEPKSENIPVILEVPEITRPEEPPPLPDAQVTNSYTESLWTLYTDFVDRRTQSRDPRPSTQAQVTSTCIESFKILYTYLVDRRTKPRDTHERNFCQTMGTIGKYCRSMRNAVALFHDWTAYVQSKTLYEALKDPAESHLRIVAFLLHRTRLAYVLAISFLHFLLAGNPLDYHPRLLQYYSGRGSQNQTDHALAAQRVAPYYRFQAIGSTTRCQSSAGLLTAGAEPVGEDQIRMQKLGVLLYEVGMWKTVNTEAEDWRSRSMAARLEKACLLECLPVNYFNAVHACLEWTPRSLETSSRLASWVSSMVVEPLKNVLEMLAKELRLG